MEYFSIIEMEVNIHDPMQVDNNVKQRVRT